MKVVKVVLTLLLLGLLAYQLDLRQLGNVIVRTDLAILAPAVLVQLGMLLLAVARWRRILHSFSIQAPFTELLRFGFIGSFFNLFLPSSIGGDVVKAFYLSRNTGRGMSTTLMTTVLERSGGLCALLIIGLVSSIAEGLRVQGVVLWQLFLLLVAGYFLANLALFNKRLHGWMTRLLSRFGLTDIEKKMELVYSGLLRLIGNRRTIVEVLLLSTAIQLSSVVIVWIAARSLAIDAPFSVFLVFIPLINLSIMVPLTINGLGLRETLYFLLFTQIGLGQEQAVALSFLNTFVIMVAALPGGIVYSRYKRDLPFDEALKADV